MKKNPKKKRSRPPRKCRKKKRPAPKKEQEEEESQLSLVVKKLTRLFDKVTNPKARASIIWVVGEHVDIVSQYAPDILRQMAKEFTVSDNDVKTQVLNLAAKLLLVNPEKTGLIAQYIFNLAKFDASYDIRDKSRLLRNILINQQGKCTTLQASAKDLIITKKPAPKMAPIPSADTRFSLGSLSHVLHHTVTGYLAIPDWSTEIQNAGERKPPEIYSPTASETNRPTAGWYDPDTYYEENEQEFYAENEGENYGDGNEEEFYGDGEYEEEEYEEGEYEEEEENQEEGEGEEYEGEEYEGDEELGSNSRNIPGNTSGYDENYGGDDDWTSHHNPDEYEGLH